MSVSVADLDVARQPTSDAQAGGAPFLKLLIHAIVEMRREPVQHHDQLPHFCREACCSSSSRPSLGALGICRRLLRHSMAVADGPAQIRQDVGQAVTPLGSPLHQSASSKDHRASDFRVLATIVAKQHRQPWRPGNRPGDARRHERESLS